jgi:hypothetical protein
VREEGLHGQHGRGAPEKPDGGAQTATPRHKSRLARAARGKAWPLLPARQLLRHGGGCEGSAGGGAAATRQSTGAPVA